MKRGRLYCSFCGKSQAEVRQLIAGPEVCICDECVDMMHHALIHNDRFVVDLAARRRARLLKKPIIPT